MLRQAFFVGLLLLVGGTGADLFNDFSLFGESEPPFQIFEWERPLARAAEPSAAAERDREPLAPDYKDPTPQASEDKPVVTAVPDNKEQPVLNPKKESQGPKQPSSTTAASALGGSIVDVDANTASFPTFPSPFGPAFDFPSLPGLDAKPMGGGAFGIGGLFGLDEGKKWWQGKNVCIEREESTDDESKSENATENSGSSTTSTTTTTTTEPNIFSTSIRLSNCFETDNKYECVTRVNNHGVVKTFTVRYKCCYGFKRTPESNGCTKQMDLKPILQTLDDLKLEGFRDLVKSTGLDATFESGNFTIFVPNDDAIHDYNEKLNDINRVESSRRRRALTHALTSKDLVQSHTTEGFVELGDMENEMKLPSEDNQKSPIRINIYPTHSYGKMYTANCARITKGNILTNNGIVHMLDKVVPPATESVEDIVKNHPKLTSFKKVLENTDIPTHFKPGGHYTIFAATDEAFSQLDEIQRQKLLSGGGCASNILKHHIVAHTICSTAIIGNATTHNVEGALLNMERTGDDDLIFESKAKIVDADLIGTNGVVHLIDTLIVPESGQYIGSVLKSHNFSKFQELVDKAGLSGELDGFDNATVFVPSNVAFEDADTQKLIESVASDPEKLKEIVRYHVIEGEVQSEDMSNNMMLPTKDEGKSLRVNLYSTVPLFTNVINRATINCARLIGFDEKTCGSVVHEVNRLLVPPAKNVLELIQNDPKYSNLTELLKGTEVEKVLQENNRSITFLAPDDDSFAALEEKDRKMLKENKEKAEEVLKNHVLTEVLCCSGVGPYTWGFNSFVPTMGNQRVEVGRAGSQIRVNRATVTKCDQVATNGVVHTINKVLAPRKQPVTALGGGFLFLDL